RRDESLAPGDSLAAHPLREALTRRQAPRPRRCCLAARPLPDGGPFESDQVRGSTPRGDTPLSYTKCPTWAKRQFGHLTHALGKRRSILRDGSKCLAQQGVGSGAEHVNRARGSPNARSDFVRGLALQVIEADH